MKYVRNKNVIRFERRLTETHRTELAAGTFEVRPPYTKYSKNRLENILRCPIFLKLLVPDKVEEKYDRIFVSSANRLCSEFCRKRKRTIYPSMRLQSRTQT